MTDKRTDGSAAGGRYSNVLDQCRDIVLIFTDSQVSELFEQVGGALLDFAERAQSNTMQGRFFEAMSLIQRRRAEIEHSFRREITKTFDQFHHRRARSAQCGADDEEAEEASDSELALVDPDEMEESVAAENLVIKANASFYPELFALSQRLSVIGGDRKPKDSEIPGGPHHLVHAFRRSIAELEVDVKIKIILYALFDKFVVKRLKTLYDELNSSLKAAGVLPNLRPMHSRIPTAESRTAAKPRNEAPRRETAGTTASTETSSDNGSQSIDHRTTSLGEELFDSIIDLMSSQRGGGRGSARHSGAPRRPVDAATAATTSRQLVSALHEVQAHVSATGVASLIGHPGDIPNLEVDTAFLDKIKQTLTEEREQVLSQIDREDLSPMDADLIDLIGMLFEYMLNDPVLPNLAKALLSHLHTPYLKVALIDRRLLVDPHHPARRLLDQMVEAGSLWVDESNPQRGIFPVMQRTVDRVLQEFTDDVALFEDLLGTFEIAMDEQQRRTETMEQRTQEAARGREKLQLAKRRATHQTQALLQRHPLPQPVVAFLSKTWLDQLVFILLRERQEERSDTWRQAVQTATDLIALFEPKAPPASRRARVDEIPGLKQQIVEGVQRMGSYSHSALDALFTLLDEPDTWEAQPAAGATAKARATAVAPDESAAPSLPESISPPSDLLSEQEQEVIARLRKMKFGTWFELASATGGAPRRIKLSWLSPLTSTCMFVDRSGMQAEIKTLHELAQEILSGRAKVIPRPKHPFIERALVSIRKVLQGDEGPRDTEPAGA